MIAIIYYAYGAPRSVDEIEGYFSHILKGKPVPAPMLEKISSMFKKPGYPDFICSSTERIARGLEIVLNQQLDTKFKVYNAYKHTAPFVEDAYAQAIEDEATTVVTLSINPILSESGGGAVHTEIAELNKKKALPHIAINDFHLNEGIVAIYADRVRRAYDWLPKAVQPSSYVLFTVHSQPIDEQKNAGYVQQFEQLARAIAQKAGIANYKAVYRSGHAAGWLGPDVKDAMKQLAADGAKGFVTCELLSLSADVESFSEINEECQSIAAELGVDFAVSEFLGDSFDTVIAVAELVKSRL